MTPLNEAVASCRAVLSASEAVLAAAGLALPASRYISVVGGDWLVGACEDCCSQLVVTPMTMIERFNDPNATLLGGADTKQATVRGVQYQVVHSLPVNLNVRDGRLEIGDVSRDFDDPANFNTHWAETVPVIAARWALARGLAKQVQRGICEVGLPCRAVSLTATEPWVEGGCAGTKLTLLVML